MTPAVSSVTDALNQRPTFEAAAILQVEALAPLSMVGLHTGKVYLSQECPPNSMLLGLMENALGLFLDKGARGQYTQALRKTLRLPPFGISSSGFQSVLQHHVRIGTVSRPRVHRYFDYWSRAKPMDDFGMAAARHTDPRSRPLIHAAMRGEVKIAEFKRTEAEAEAEAEARQGGDILSGWTPGERVHFTRVAGYLPQFYSSPTLRQYVIPDAPYRVRVETSKTLADILRAAFEDPAAPLYLGNSDGWVDTEWTDL